MSEILSAIPTDHPIMRAWKEYTVSAGFENAFTHAANHDHRRGSLWAAFLQGWNAAAERAASLYDTVDPASDRERLDGDPGAGAMGAVIEYRDKIRGIKP